MTNSRGRRTQRRAAARCDRCPFWHLTSQNKRPPARSQNRKPNPAEQHERRPEVTDQQQNPPFAEGCIVELLGHRRLAGHIREVQLAGAGFLRLDIPATAGHAAQTQYVAPGSVYALHPVDEATARLVAASSRPEPVHRWELPAVPDPDEDDDDPDDDEEAWGGVVTVDTGGLT